MAISLDDHMAGAGVAIDLLKTMKKRHDDARWPTNKNRSTREGREGHQAPPNKGIRTGSHQT